MLTPKQLTAKLLNYFSLLTIAVGVLIVFIVGLLIFGFKYNDSSIKSALSKESTLLTAPQKCTESYREVSNTESGLSLNVIYTCDGTGKEIHDDVISKLTSENYAPGTDYTKDGYTSLTYKSKNFVATYSFNPNHPNTTYGPNEKVDFDKLRITEMVLQLHKYR